MRKKESNQKKTVMSEGKRKVQNEMNLFTMLQTVGKLKAAVTILVGSNEVLKR